MCARLVWCSSRRPFEHRHHPTRVPAHQHPPRSRARACGHHHHGLVGLVLLSICAERLPALPPVARPTPDNARGLDAVTTTRSVFAGQLTLGQSCGRCRRRCGSHPRAHPPVCIPSHPFPATSHTRAVPRQNGRTCDRPHFPQTLYVEESRRCQTKSPKTPTTASTAEALSTEVTRTHKGSLCAFSVINLTKRRRPLRRCGAMPLTFRSKGNHTTIRKSVSMNFLFSSGLVQLRYVHVCFW